MLRYESTHSMQSMQGSNGATQVNMSCGTPDRQRHGLCRAPLGAGPPAAQLPPWCFGPAAAAAGLFFFFIFFYLLFFLRRGCSCIPGGGVAEESGFCLLSPGLVLAGNVLRQDPGGNFGKTDEVSK